MNIIKSFLLNLGLISMVIADAHYGVEWLGNIAISIYWVAISLLVILLLAFAIVPTEDLKEALAKIPAESKLKQFFTLAGVANLVASGWLVTGVTLFVLALFVRIVANGLVEEAKV